MGKYTVNNNFPKCNIWITVLAQNAFSLWDGSANPDEFPRSALATDWGFAAAQAK